MDKKTWNHLTRLYTRTLDLLADEVGRVVALNALYDDFGQEHPADTREGHVQSLLFAGYRAEGYFTEAETRYFWSAGSRRQIDLGVFIPDSRVWLFLEVKPWGDAEVLSDAKKLMGDDPQDESDRLRGIVAYRFRDSTQGGGTLTDRSKGLSSKLKAMGFREVGLGERDLQSGSFQSVEVGFWVTS
jgi:hypothetical protein